MKTAANIINSVVAPVKEFFGIKPETQEQKIRKEIVKSQMLINIEERSGEMYIIYRSSAGYEKHSFMKLDQDITVKEALDILNAARSAAVSYNTL